MERTFSEPFLLQLQQTAAENTPDQLKEQVMAQPDLGIDISNRNVYILDEIGKLLTSSDENAAAVDVTANLLTAMNGEVGQSSSITNAFMDLAIPIETDSGQYIVSVSYTHLT